MDKYHIYLSKAIRLVEDLKAEVKNNPSVMCENYGQKEIRKLIAEMEALDYGLLTYQEQYSIKGILYQVSSIC